MVQKIALALLAVVAVLAVGLFTLELKNETTGQYYASGGGRYYYGTMKAQLQPDEACIYQGFEPVYPVQVYTNEYGTLMSLCKLGEQFVGVPIVQTVLVP